MGFAFEPFTFINVSFSIMVVRLQASGQSSGQTLGLLACEDIVIGLSQELYYNYLYYIVIVIVIKKTVMERKIVNYHLDEENDWVAELECHHGQHVRHNPPFINRPWVTTQEGRDSKVGFVLNCKKCRRNEPEDTW